jgi:orotate phosphoribosyltransferase
LLEKSYQHGEVTLTSGRRSDYYFDCKQTALHPEGSYLLGRLILDAIFTREELFRLAPGEAS